ncbi:MYXO-CTERM sorting domain-containing protein [Streptomyces sp. NPDC001480]|uniref:MYXO-CTERM sorting domain-containing protein n=1 Tax=Streptomyces sp. NPDC001480 TaxID=3364577 RepID=UPI0036AFA77F
MIRTAARRHATWWKAPLVASLLGLPFLALEYRWFGSHHETGAFGGVLYWACGLLALAWLLPRRRSLRTSRILAAGAGLGFALLPALWLMVAIAVTPSS